ncbi:HNH endonuclease [Acinetobacter sp. WCHAc060033]|uniref:HNH endonuclease n=1 Tax=Acinetobacter sp. WCHAc060033 TaxID=2518624 RepID=UPI001022D9E0|nr:HNH endonuclease [Acinetobacter sp. WCHAc060033]RZG86161.1 HNH endonuclease [Acinetobacter sp. WCHAc060033]
MFRKPLPNFTIQDTYPVCISYISNAGIKQYMVDMQEHVYTQSEKYLKLISQSKLQELDIPTIFNIPVDTNGRKSQTHENNWFVKLYKYYLSKNEQKYSDANKFYNRIKLDGVINNNSKRCCYCNNHKIEVVDHFLPESKYIFLAVNPINLVPACEECNDNKHAYSPSATEPVLVHPYFDFIDHINWLDVRLVERVEAKDENKYIYSFEYFVKEISESSVSIDRIKKTFEELKINNNITFDAQNFFNTELIYDLRDPEELGGLLDTDLALHFKRKSEKLVTQGYGLNHWKVALYQMLSSYSDLSFFKENPS